MFSGAIWSAIERFSIQSLRLVLGIVLARLLTPDDYGILGILMIFIAVSATFIESGISKALIQKKERDSLDFSTAFVFNIVISLICYAILFFTAPLIADFYENPELTSLVRVISLALVLNALYLVPSTILSIKLDFKTLAKINLATTIVSGSIAIALAYMGYGVWSLVWQSLIRNLLYFVLTTYFTKYKFETNFSKNSLKSLFRFGSNILVSSLLARFVSDFSSLAIGKLSSTAQLGIFTRGMQFPDFFSASIDKILSNILLPGLAPHQDNLKLLREKFERIIEITALVSFPIFFGLFVLAEPFILTLLTAKWEAAIPIMQVFCFARLLAIFSGANINMLYVIGRSDLVLKQQYLAIVVRIALILPAIFFGIFYVALAELIATTLHLFINSYHSGKKLNYPIWEQLKSMRVYFLSSSVILVLAMLLKAVVLNKILLISLSLVMGVAIYYILIRKFKPQDINFFRKNLLKK